MGRVGRPGRKHLLVFTRNPEHLADHRRRNRPSEIGHQIHLTLLRHAIEQLVRDDLHSRATALDRTLRERLADEFANPRMRRRILKKHEASRLFLGFVLPGQETIRAAHACEGSAQQPANVFVSRQSPIAFRRQVDRLGLAQRAVRAVGIFELAFCRLNAIPSGYGSRFHCIRRRC